MMAGCGAQNVSALKEKNVCFPNYRESRVYGDSTKTKKTAVQHGCQGALQAGTVSVSKSCTLCNLFPEHPILAL